MPSRPIIRPVVRDSECPSKPPQSASSYYKDGAVRHVHTVCTTHYTTVNVANIEPLIAFGYVGSRSSVSFFSP
jgi:hypothetical protein